MKTKLLTKIVWLLCLSAFSKTPAMTCEAVSKQVVHKNLIIFKFPIGSETLPAILNDYPLLNQYRTEIEKVTDTDPFALLIRQRKLFEPFGEAYLSNFDLLIRKKVNGIGEISCMDAWLLEHHMERFPNLLKQPSEFGAFVLSSLSEKNLNVIFNSSETLGVLPDPAAEKIINESVKQGAKILFHLHNHPFMLENPTGDIAGTLIPSGTRLENFGDLGYYSGIPRSWRIQGFRITNGFNTLRVRTDELRLFR